MTNPLLVSHRIPPFKTIQAEHVVPAITSLIDSCRQGMNATLENLTTPTWASLVQVLEQQGDKLEQAWSPVSHINAVLNSEAMREAYTDSVKALTEYGTEVGQNAALCQAYQQLADSDEYAQLNRAQQKTIDNALRDFRLAGVALGDDKKQRYGQIKSRLSELSTQFSNNVLDATQSWHKHIADIKDLAGLPESALAQAEQAAKQKELKGYVITLDFPSYIAVMMHADNSELRREVYTAFATRASSEGKKSDGSSAAEWDNSELINETLSLRHELAQLLGFDNYAERSLATKMAEDGDQVIGFLSDLAEQSLPIAKRDYAEIEAFAKKEYNVKALNAWDLTYYSEKLRQAVYAISQEELRPYFPAETVTAGMFAVVKRLYNIDVIEEQGVDIWQADVRYFRIEKNGQEIASFYLDIFARENKRGGAWMADCRVRRQTPAGLQKPVAFLTCNFTPPVGDVPSLLTHNEVTTLFHEFGHGLHHMLTQVDVAAVSGINGVPWDAVELPSQFLENWCWEPEVISMISSHYESGEALPKELLDKMLAAKNFQSGMQMVRQLEFSLFDFRLHREYRSDKPTDVQSLLNDIRQQVAVVAPPAFNKFQNGFSHIFAGGYAAGYYSYKWAEVLSADAYSRFEEEGIFNSDTGRSFLEDILEMGGSQEPMALFVKFRGREPSVEALLRHCGIA